MAKFDRINGVFTTRLADGKSGVAFEDRHTFKRAGWLIDPKTKAWITTDIEKARKLGQYAIGSAKEHLDNADAIAAEVVAASWAEDTDTEFPVPEGINPSTGKPFQYLPFQKAGIEYALERDNVLIADPPGLGKTIQAIGVHNAQRATRVLIICPASLKVNWQREWEKWDVHGLTVGIAESKQRTKTVQGVTNRWTEHIWPDTNVVVVNYDMLDTFDEQIKAVKWDLMVADECHLLKSKEAVRTKCVFGGKRKAQKRNGAVIKDAITYLALTAKRKLFLTGTPILSRPVELWNIVRACDPTGLGKKYETFVYQYCDAWYDGNGLDVSGKSNLEELNRFMRERFMVRRDKRAVLSELPDKTREVIMLPVDKLEAPVRREKSRVEAALEAYERLAGVPEDANPFRFIKAVDSLSAQLQAAIEAQDSEVPDFEAAVKTLSEPDQILFTEMSNAREEVALAKVGLVVDHVKKLVECEEPVILFAYHTSVIDELKKRLEGAGLRVGIITGSVPSKKRQQIVDDFQAGLYDVILGNIIAMGVGYTMTIARFVVFAEIDWVPSLMEQAEDRAWRHGQKNMVIAQYLLVDGSIEAYIAVSMLEKMETIWEALDKR